MSAPIRVLFHVQHLLGIGHQVRAAAIARAMQAEGLSVWFVDGGLDAPRTDIGGARHIRLPGARTADVSFSRLVDADGREVDESWRRHRVQALLEAYDQARPDVVLIESFPFARRQFRFELLPLLHRAEGEAAIAVSIRDILVRKDKPARTKEVLDLVAGHVDRVLVHGSPDIASLDLSFPAAAEFADRTVYTGYVDGGPAPGTADTSTTGEIVVSAGGGAAGGPLLRAAAAVAASAAGPGPRWRFLIGPNLPEEDRAALVSLPGTVTVEPARPDFRSLLSGAALSISQAGYNTIVDLAQTGCRSLLVPFAAPGETEQAMRAALLEKRGWANVLPEESLAPEALMTAIGHALAKPAPGPWPIDTAGAQKTAKCVAVMGRLQRGGGRASLGAMP